MFKKIWQSFVRWFRKLFGGGTGKAINRVPAAELPPLEQCPKNQDQFRHHFLIEKN